MPVAPPTSPTRPSADPDWGRWEAELSERRVLRPGRPGPPDPPQPPSDGPGDRPGGDDRQPERADLLWLKLLVASFVLLASIAFFASHQQVSDRSPILSPVPPVAASQVAAERDEAANPVRVRMQIPPAPTQK